MNTSGLTAAERQSNAGITGSDSINVPTVKPATDYATMAPNELTDLQEPMPGLVQLLAEMGVALRDQAERQTQLLEAIVNREAPPYSGLVLPKMSGEDDPETFLEVFEVTATACGWPEEEWAVRLLPLLSGEAQTAAVGLPAPARQYGNVKRAILDRLGFSTEEYRRRFREARLGPADRPFAFAQRLKHSAARWLQPGDSAGEARIMETLVLEQFVEALPADTSAWVRCHRPEDLAAAITLAENHRAAQPAVPVQEPPAQTHYCGETCYRRRK